jgi:hypothetical protein
MDSGLLVHTLPRPAGLRECEVVMDIGAGIRPMGWYRPRRHICIEPYLPYCHRLRALAPQLEVHCLTAQQALCRQRFPGVEAVYLLDVIEHMDKALGWWVLFDATHVADVQVVLYTPHGFKEQYDDPWGLGGAYWQEHRSGWLPSDFAELGPAWRTELFVPEGATEPEGFFAIWDKPTSTQR